MHFCLILNYRISSMQNVQYCERSLLESQRPGTVLHSLVFAGLIHSIAVLYWWDSSGSTSKVILIIFSSGDKPQHSQGLEYLSWRGWGLYQPWEKVDPAQQTTRSLTKRRAGLFTTVNSGRMRQWKYRVDIGKLFFAKKPDNGAGCLERLCRLS